MDPVELFNRGINRPTRIRPSFIIIGAQKAGTSALFQMLAKHPDILAPGTKEMHHFDVEGSYAQGMGHYLSRFPVRSIWRRYITFEATPSYLFHAEKVAPRIKKDLPETTCVAILRDPVKRAYSAWNMFRDFKNDAKRAKLHDPRSFQQAVEDELAGRTRHEHHLYLARGHYAGQIAHFKAHFPEDRLIIRSYLDLRKNGDAFVNGLCGSLGIAPMPQARSVEQVKANTRAYTEPLDPGLAKALYQYFAPEMLKLRDTLGYDPEILEGHG
ncbi:MAG: sulfotransferase [Flavobacteriales bacterium]|nr:sulfotransferase [Flavobacteriales bacterium]MBK7248362.1 sulfotransferase [Flavobacteriales bacterium]MBK9598192.1 sulfotransferase [Flavobacteriales bacterium]